ncbi:MAG: hypothetical protein HON90_00420 [Halobacteriovoraceae bacterium]|nr:hypothetical protein [Halobacteriovoraceae bacterium]
MFKEFFIEKILNKSMALYLVSHQLILPIIALYCFSLSTDLNMDQLLSLKSAAAILLISLPSFIFEIGRKTWNPEREQQTADSYTKVWGIKKTVVVINLATLIYGMVAGAFFSTQFFMSYSGMIFILLLFLTIIISSVFAYKPTAKNSKMVEGVTSAVLLLGHLLCVIYFI